MIKEVKTADEINRCFPVMSQLRQHLQESDFVDLIKGMAEDGFRLAYFEHEGEVVCVAGFRVTTTLFMGKNLYVDDLVTHKSYRSQGFGAAMLGWLREQAVASGCGYFHLDSGTQRERAHKFYFSQGMTITTFHFAETLDRK